MRPFFKFLAHTQCSPVDSIAGLIIIITIDARLRCEIMQIEFGSISVTYLPP